MIPEEISQRLTSLRHYFGKFTLVGSGLNVQGSVRDGFILSRATENDVDAGAPTPPPPECPSVGLICNSISASRSKCGFAPLIIGGTSYAAATYDGGGPNVGLEEPTPVGSPVSDVAKFLKRTEVDNGTNHPEDHNNSGCDPYQYTGQSHSGTLTKIHEYDRYDCGGPGSSSCEGAVTTTTHINPADYGIGGSPCDIYYTADCDGDDHSTNCVPDTGKQDALCQGWTGSITLENEFTTAMLLADTIAALPAYAPEYGCGGVRGPGQSCFCSSYKHTQSEEFSITIRRAKYKFQFPERTDYLKIFWTVRFDPEAGGGFTDTEMSWTHVAGTAVTESDEFELLEPDDNGEIRIVNVRWAIDESCNPTPAGGCIPAEDDCSYENCCQPIPE